MSATAAKATDGPPLGLSAAAGRPVAEVFDRLGTSEAGLAGTDADARLRTFGANVLPARPVTAWGILLGQLRNPLLILLLAAAAVSGAHRRPDRRGHHRRDRGPERRARVRQRVPLRERRRRAARRHPPRGARVARRRADARSTSPTLVPGRRRRAPVGDVVPADLRIARTDQLECDEAVLTGESLAGGEDGGARRRARTRRSTCRPARSWAPIVHQGAGRRASSSRPARRTAFGEIAVGLGERQAETAFQVGLRGFSRLPRQGRRAC